MFSYAELVERRKALRASGYATLAEVGFDGDWITPYQIRSRSSEGPVLVAHHWLDAPSVERHRGQLADGFLPGIPFNEVLDRALAQCGMSREHIYVTQVFHLLPTEERCEKVPDKLVDESFETVTRYELFGRRVIALGNAAARACARHKVAAIPSPHPSARRGTYDERAMALAALLRG